MYPVKQLKPVTCPHFFRYITHAYILLLPRRTVPTDASPVVIPMVFTYGLEFKSMRMNPWDFPLWCHVFAWLVADRSTTVKPSKFLKKRIDITRTNTSFFYSNQLREHLRLDQFRIRSPSWQPVMAKSIPVGKTPGQQERRQRSAAGTLIMQCTAEHPESEGLHHVSDSLLCLGT